MFPDRKPPWKMLAVVLYCWALIASMLSAYYGYQYSETLRRYEATVLRISVIFDYGNGSAHRRQHRDMMVLSGESLLSITIRLAKTKTDVYPIGAMVTSIDGLENTKSRAWLWYRWSVSSNTWLLGETGADQFKPRNGEIVLWYYASLATWPPSPPQPPSTVGNTKL